MSRQTEQRVLDAFLARHQRSSVAVVQETYTNRGWGVPPDSPEAVSSPEDVYFQSKRIDNDGSDWTFPIFSHRTVVFHLRRLRPAYEVISTWAELSEVMRLRAATGKIPGDGTASVTLELFSGVYDAPAGQLTPPTKTEKLLGKHVVSIVKVGPIPETLIFRNSWGKEWGDDGFGILGRKYFERHCTEAWLFREDAAALPPRARPLPFAQGRDAFVASARDPDAAASDNGGPGSFSPLDALERFGAKFEHAPGTRPAILGHALRRVPS